MTNYNRTLIIPINEENPPEKYSEVLVTILPFTASNGAPANNNYSWSYYINGDDSPAENDITPPVIESAYINKENLCIEASVYDMESGIKSAAVTYKKVKNADGTLVDPPEEISGAEYELKLDLFARNYKATIDDMPKYPVAACYYKAYLTIADRKGNETIKELTYENEAETIIEGDVKTPKFKDFKLTEGQMLQTSYAEKVLAEIPALKSVNATQYLGNKYLISVTNKIDCSFSVQDYAKIDYIKYGLKKLYSLDSSKKVNPFSEINPEEDLGVTVICENLNNENYDFNGFLSLGGYNLTSGIYQLYYKSKDGLGNEGTSEKIDYNEYFICAGIEQYYDAQAAAYENDTTGPDVTYSTMKKSGGTDLVSAKFMGMSSVKIGDTTYKSLLLSDSKLVITGTINDDGSGPEKIELSLARYFKEKGNGADGYEMTISNSSGITEDELNAAVKVSPNPSVSVTQNGTFELTFDLSGLEDGIYIPVGLQGFDRKGNASAEVVINEIDPSNLLTAEIKAFILNNH